MSADLFFSSRLVERAGIADDPLIHGMLKPPHFFKNAHEAAAERCHPVLHFHRRFVTEDCPLQDPEAAHFPQPLVHHLG